MPDMKAWRRPWPREFLNTKSAVFLSINHVFRFEHGKGKNFRREVSVAVCWCFTDSGAERRFQYQSGTPKVREATKMESKRMPKQAKEPSQTPLRNRVEKVSKKHAKRRKPRCPFWIKIVKNLTKIPSKNIHFKYYFLYKIENPGKASNGMSILRQARQ